MQLTELKGVGEATAERVKSAGADSVDDLASMTVEQLEEAGLSDTKAEKLIRRAQRETVVMQSAAEARQEAESKEYVTTGMEALDEVLGGGYREGHVAGISGESSSGKTQLVFRALGAAVEQTGDPAVYIETERERFSVERISELSNLDPEVVEEKVWRAKAYSLDQQLEAYAAVAESFDTLSLVVVDSFTARFRLNEAFNGRGSLTDRNHEMVKHLNGIDRLVEKLDVPVLLTLQVQGDPTPYGSNSATWGGTLMDHTITYDLKTAQAQGQFRKIQLRGHPSQSDGEVLLTIGEDELTAHKDS